MERLPTYDRLRRGMLTQVLDSGRVVRNEVKITKLGVDDKKLLMDSILKAVEDDNEKFLTKLRERNDRILVQILGLAFERRCVLRNLYPNGRVNKSIDKQIYTVQCRPLLPFSGDCVLRTEAYLKNKIQRLRIEPLDALIQGCPGIFVHVGFVGQ